MIDMDTSSETLSIFDFFKESRFMIPEIQRNFTWTAKEQVGKLFTDLCKFYENGKNTVPQYFLGTSILYEGDEYGGAKDIMDGQQRVTSLVVLYSAIKTILEKTRQDSGTTNERKMELEDAIEKISEKIIFHDNKFSKCRLEPKDNLDAKIIKTITTLDGKNITDVYFKEINKRELNQPLTVAYIYFYTHLEKFALTMSESKKGKTPSDVLIEFSEVVGERVLFTKTVTKTLPMAFQMFVSVNGAGKPLISYDVLRGIIIAKAHSLGLQKEVNTSLRLLNKMVEKLRGTQANEKAADSKVTASLTYWLECREGKNIQANGVIDILEEKVRDFTTADQFDELLEEYESFVNWYTILNSSDTRSAFAYYDSYTRDRILCLTGKSKNWVSSHVGVLVCLRMKSCSFEETTKVMQLIEWVEFRGYFTQMANKLENILPQIARRILDGKSVDNWGPTLTKQLVELMKSKGSNFDNLATAKIDENKARAFLHKITESQLSINRSKLTAGQLMPLGAPKPWKSKGEREEGGSVSCLIGNWFLIQGQTATDIKKWPVDNSQSRVKHFEKHSVAGVAKTEISQYASLINSNPSFFNTQKINSRTRIIIRLLNNLFPVNGPKYDLSLLKSKNK